MHFNVESDDGQRIIAYVIPDGFSAIPTISLCSSGAEILRCEANEIREAIVHVGRHETGRCGFNIGPEICPELQTYADLSIYEIDTGMLIYRRPNPDRISKRILRLETHLFPLWRFDDVFSQKFQYFQRGAEQFGRETIIQMFLLNGVDSVYLSGRISHKAFAYWIEDGFETAIMLQDPYEEMAERFLVLSNLGDAAIRYLGERDALRLKPAINYVTSLPLQDERRLRHRLMEMPTDVSALFTNPLVRQLTAANPEEMPGSSAIGAALDILASCSVLGLREDPHFFTQATAEWLGLDPEKLSIPPIFPRVSPLAALLKESRTVDHLLERDLEVYAVVKDAYGGG